MNTMVRRGQEQKPVKGIVAPVHDIMNECFHEHRPSFRTLLSKFEHNKGSFTYKITHTEDIRDLLQKQKSVRLLSKQSSRLSLSSMGALASLGENEESHFVEDEDFEDMRAPSDHDSDDQPENGDDSLVFVDDDYDNDMSRLGHDEPIERRRHDGDHELPVFASGVFHEHYELGNVLGSGAYAIVKEGSDRRTGDSYAIKIVEIDSLDELDLDALQIEISVMGSLNHPNIVRLYEAYSECDYYYLVTEKMMGGELLDRVVQKTFYNEKEARDTCTILFEAMHYCHSRQVAHRDLKPENLLLASNECDSNIKIADFGFAKKCPASGFETMCGTPGYVAPEVLERTHYNTQCDLWSLGVIVYILLGGYSPFEENSQDLLFKRIRAGDYTFHEEFWGSVSDDGKDLIRALLTVNPRDRLTAEQALQHTWMTASDEVLASMDLGANLMELKRFNAKRKFRAAVKTIIATQKLTSLFISCEARE